MQNLLFFIFVTLLHVFIAISILKGYNLQPYPQLSTVSSILLCYINKNLFVLDKVVWVALAAIKDYVDGRLCHAIHTGAKEVGVIGGRSWWPAVVAFSQARLPHQDLSQEHVLNPLI